MNRGFSVAVVIPVRNGEGEIGDCVRAVLAQTVPPDDIVVVDNGSTDGTAREAIHAGARVISETRPGSYAARNAGVAATSSDIVAFTDADCVPRPSWLERLIGAFDDPAVGEVGGCVEAVRMADRTAAERWAETRAVLDQAAAFDHPFLPYFATANAAFRRRALAAIGGFESSLSSGGDVDAAWRLQVQTGYRLAFVAEACVEHHHRRRVRTLVAQHRRYARGHGRLDRRWSHHPGYAPTVGSAVERARAAWLLPLRLPYRLIRRQPLDLPLIDAAVRVAHEIGRWEGRRQPPLSPAHLPRRQMTAS